MLQKAPDPWSLARLNTELTALDLGIVRSDYSRVMFEGPRSEVEIAARQVLLAASAGERLNAAILESMGSDGRPVAAPIPRQWVNHLRRSGLSVSRQRCVALFALMVARRFRGGLGQILAVIRQVPDSGVKPGVPHAHFVDVQADNLPRPSGKESFDVVTWYLRWTGRDRDIVEIRHPILARGTEAVGGVLLRPVRGAPPALPDVAAKMRFAGWSVYAILAALAGMVTGRWVNALLLGDAARARHVALLSRDVLAREYMFSLSNSVYRPLWTYAAERRGSTITMFNYAASFYRFKTDRGYPHLELGFESMTWPRVLLWSEPLVTFSRANLKRVRAVELVPPICFSDSEEELPRSDRPCVAVFDVTPVRPACLPPFVPEIDYRNFEVGKRFLEDVYSALVELGYDMMWKRKRAFGSRHDRRYVRLAGEVSVRPGVLDVPPGISAFRVVDACRAVISMPFTSTGLIGVARSRPSVYYDPTGVLYKDDRAAQGVPLLSNRKELVEWLSQ